MHSLHLSMTPWTPQQDKSSSQRRESERSCDTCHTILDTESWELHRNWRQRNTWSRNWRTSKRKQELPISGVMRHCHSSICGYRSVMGPIGLTLCPKASNPAPLNHLLTRPQNRGEIQDCNISHGDD